MVRYPVTFGWMSGPVFAVVGHIQVSRQVVTTSPEVACRRTLERQRRVDGKCGCDVGDRHVICVVNLARSLLNSSVAASDASRSSSLRSAWCEGQPEERVVVVHREIRLKGRASKRWADVTQDDAQVLRAVLT